MHSPEKDPIKQLQELTKRANASIDDDAAFDAAVNELNEKLLVEELKRLDELLGISKQYESQLDILRNTGIISKLSDGSEGIFEEDGTDYPVPSLLSIVQRFCEDGNKYELLRRKVEQGFTKLILVPFALSLQELVDRYGEQLVSRLWHPGQLFGEGESPAGNAGKVAEVLALNTDTIYKAEEYQIQQLVYFPEFFESHNHGGLTKEEAITQKGGWQVYLIEETPIPRKGKGKNRNGRDQLEAGLSPRQYLEKLQADPQYKGEVGLTPESWLMKAMTHLRERDEVIDDWKGKGSLNSLLGAYFPGSGDVADACWHRDDSQARLGGIDADGYGEGFGASSAVRV